MQAYDGIIACNSMNMAELKQGNNNRFVRGKTFFAYCNWPLSSLLGHCSGENKPG